MDLITKYDHRVHFEDLIRALSLLLVVINYIFTGIYIIECFLKLYGLGPRRYFTSQFNRIDFLVRLSKYTVQDYLLVGVIFGGFA